MTTLTILTDISIIILAIQLFIILLVPGIILYFVVFKGVLRLPTLIRQYAPLVQFQFRRAAEVSEEASHKVAAPVMAVEVFVARLQRMRRAL